MVKGEPLTSEWEEIDGSWYYFDKDGYAVQDTWKKIGGSWYLFKMRFCTCRPFY